nr:uncharacterized protein LOC103423373 [Malus domestica]
MGSTGSDVFTEIGFTNWKKGSKNLQVHEGGVGSLHNKAVQQARDLMTQKQHIETFVIKQTDEARINYRTLLSASLECTRWLLGQGLPFRGHDESLKSSNRGNYLELMQFLSKHNEQVRKVVFENAAPKNLKYTSSDIQKDLVRACAIETVGAITKDMEAVVEVVEWIKSDRNQDNLGEATRLFKDIQTFDFTFHLFLMRLILGITNELSQALQKKDQDIVNAMALVEVCKQRLQSLRDDDFGDLLHDVEKFCEANMEDLHFVSGKSRRKAPKITNFHYYCVDLYFQVLDMQLKELNDRFNEVNTELLLCMACLSPVNNFASFDKAKIVRLAQLYSQDFDRMDLMNLPIQLDNYIHDMKMHSEFSSLRGISDLAQELVKTGSHENDRPYLVSC